MKKYEKLLEYQAIDTELRKLLDEIERSEDSKKLEQARNEFNGAKTAMVESEKQAGNIVAYYNSAVTAYEDCVKQIDELSKQMAATEDIEAQREIAAQLEKVRENLVDSERKLIERAESGDKVIKSYLDGNERGKKMRDVYNKIKERLDAMRAERKPKMNELNAKLDAIRPQIDPETMELYKSITAERKYPAFVEAIPSLDKKGYRCFCGLTLSQKAQSDLLSNGQCRCETCRRLIFTND